MNQWKDNESRFLKLGFWDENLNLVHKGPKGHTGPQLVSHTPNTRTGRAGAKWDREGSICELSGTLDTTLGPDPAGFGPPTRGTP